jgi:hypothetical protein
MTSVDGLRKAIRQNLRRQFLTGQRGITTTKCQQLSHRRDQATEREYGNGLRFVPKIPKKHPEYDLRIRAYGAPNPYLLETRLSAEVE